jgi:hypothetical protein
MTEQLPTEGGALGNAQSWDLRSRSPLDPTTARLIIHARLRQLLGRMRLSPAGLSRLVSRIDSRSYAAGEVIVKQGVRGDFMGLVGAGQVGVDPPPELESLRESVLEEPTALLLPGSTFGEVMLIDGRPSGTTLRALSDVVVYYLRRQDYLWVAGMRSSRLPRQAGRWQSPVFVAALWAFTVFSVAVFSLGLFLQLRLNRSEIVPAGPFTVLSASDRVQITAPQPGQALRLAETIPVQAVLTGEGFRSAELKADGIGQGLQVNGEPDTTPWLATWDWQEPSEGSHMLAIEASVGGRRLLASEPLTVTVVPSGTLAFATNRDGSQSIYSMGTDGRDLTRLTTGPGATRQPLLGADGSLTYVADPETGVTTIRRMEAGGKPARDLANGRDPAWAPDGSTLAYAASPDGISQIFVLAQDGGESSQVTAAEIYAGQPTWSPDGRYLAFVNKQDGNWDIWVQSLDGQERRRLTDDPAMDWGPAWSPDGSQLAFVSDREGSHQIYIMRMDGSGVRILTDFARGAESPAWSPQGYWIAFVAYTGEGDGVDAREIYLMRADGRDQVRLTHNSFDDTQPAWRHSP